MGDRRRGEEDPAHEGLARSSPDLPLEAEQAPDSSSGALRRRRLWKVPAPNGQGERSASPAPLGNSGADLGPVLSALREQAAVLAEILDRLPPARGDPCVGRGPCARYAQAAGSWEEQSGSINLRQDSVQLEVAHVGSDESMHALPAATRMLSTPSTPSAARGKPLKSKLASRRRSPSSRPSNRISRSIRRVVASPTFDIVFGALILLNTIIMGVEEQYMGSQVGYELGFYTHYGSPQFGDGDGVLLGGDRHVFRTAEIVFAVIFSFEVILRMAGLGWHFFRRPSEHFDLAVVVLSDLSIIFSSIETPINIQLLRLLRATKLLRLVKLIRTIEGFDALHLMMTALGASAWALCWSILLLLFIQVFVAMIVTNVFRSAYLDAPTDLSEEVRLELFEYFGTFSRSMMSLFELALANWPPICRWLMENLHEGFMLLAISFKLVMGIAVIGVIQLLFIQETIKVAHTDDDIMLRAKLRASKQHQRRMEDLFAITDADHSGRIQRSELRRIMADKSIAMWLASMDLDPTDSDTLFDLLKGPPKDEAIDINELITGISRLQGAARAIDMRKLLMHADRRHLAGLKS
ncbi:unnamed protein product [Prorocentrum cordatum]|uniref:EF-hand domain-containing protein n=1 Tax=Prorocentrum cordatum TaxID=2364126 RepID=A0ABN9WK30_9DINO|nr:unnamed protein product [Polarella glacialis]